MGVLTDIVVVDRKHARRVLKSACPSRDFGGLDAKGIDTVKLGTLHAALYLSAALLAGAALLAAITLRQRRQAA